MAKIWADGGGLGNGYGEDRWESWVCGRMTVMNIVGSRGGRMRRS